MRATETGGKPQGGGQLKQGKQSRSWSTSSAHDSSDASNASEVKNHHKVDAIPTREVKPISCRHWEDADEEIVENRNAGLAHQRWPFGFASPGFGKKIPVLGGWAVALVSSGTV